MSSKNKNIRHLYRARTQFKKGYQPRSNLMKDERIEDCRFQQHFKQVEEQFKTAIPHAEFKELLTYKAKYKSFRYKPDKMCYTY
jgi:mannitol/fructose-specific phosphotransferase system IIA component (Ntr-type)